MSAELNGSEKTTRAARARINPQIPAVAVQVDRGLRASGAGISADNGFVAVAGFRDDEMEAVIGLAFDVDYPGPHTTSVVSSTGAMRWSSSNSGGAC